MAKKVRVAIAGVGNCASALTQGIVFYSQHGTPEQEVIGLTSYDMSGITPGDIEIVAAFDVNAEKVGRDLSEAIFAKPNNTVKITEVPKFGVKVQRAPVLDGIGKYLKEVVKISDEPEVSSIDSSNQGLWRRDSCELSASRKHQSRAVLRGRGD